MVSLNASPEAERASALGVGFSVIAQEIRVLVKQTEDVLNGIVREMTDIGPSKAR
ncbi:MAG: hypothetical protein AAF919_17090 [Pseudomonadota bacterium]